MAFSGFGRQSGPAGPPPPKSANPFNQFTRPPSPSPSPPLSPLTPSTPFSTSSFSPIRYPRRPEYSQVLQSPSPSLSSTISSSDPLHPSFHGHRPYESSFRQANGQRLMARDSVVETNQRPPAATSLIASRSAGTSFSAKIARYPDARPLQSTEIEPLRNSSRNFVSSQLDFRPRSPVDYADSFLDNNYHPLQSEGHGRIRSPPIEHVGSQRNSNLPVGNRQVLVSRTTQSPPLDLDNRHSPLEIHQSREAQRPTSTSLRSPQRLPGNYEFSIAHQNKSSVSPHVGSYGNKSSSPVKLVGYAEERKKMSSPSPAVNGVFQGNSRVKDMSISSSVSPSAVSTISDNINWPDLGVHRNALSENGDGSATSSNKTGVFPVPKRTRSPDSLSMDQDLKQNSYSSHNEEEREMQAKAKRLARFKIELSEPVKNGSKFINPKVSYSKEEPSMMEGVSSQCAVNLRQDFPVDDILPDNEGPEPSNIIIGLCPDMCPESERAERERKGDLDQYERLGGDRNQTDKFLAVKKYNRTAEREAILIRPMPVLQKTVLYLLNLLDQPYDERFLGIYNFLWDRMRAVRMDLRMQHIFNLESVKMLEQMIRLHIIAMHELCEYEKGEGFSEGFDAHLNIEQMNKTSAELFQLYDDHRKKGINVPTEKEFRGYYALLKLDKHPGYKVEPAELSLDLAKMTPEIRQAAEVRFARDVARACRTGNFIAFFRLARKASYLQACLMHAHFAKLRSQALASLHSGLQNNQGLPAAVIARWLAMEEEDIESLLEYHGFTIKEYEEPYVVKEGPFLHGDSDYPTKCSNLVNSKRSATIVEDVLPSKVEAPKPALEARTTNFENDTVQFPENGSPVDEVEEEMPDSAAFSSPKESNGKHLMLETTRGRQHKDLDHKMASSSPKASSFMGGNSPWNFSVAFSSPKVPQTNTTVLQHKDVDHNISGVRSSPWNVKAPQTYSVAPQHEDVDHKISGVRSSPWKNIISSSPRTPHQNMVATLEPLKSPESTTSSRIEMKPVQVLSGGSLVDRVPNNTDYSFQKPMPLDEEKSNSEELPEYHKANAIEEVLLEDEDEELAEAKLKLIIRLWKRRASRLRELRNQRQLAAANALNALSLGPRIGCNEELSSSSDTFNIDQVMRKRYEKCEQSWSTLNVADMAADVLIQKNPNARCLCWKVLFCSTMSTQQVEEPGPSCRVTHLAAARWLHAKLMPDQAQDDNLVLSSPGLSIWRKWVSGQFGRDLTCLLSVMKDTSSDNFSEAVQGASAVLFFLSDSIPFEHQKIHLHNLIASLPSESCLPLLILSDSNKGDMSDTSSISNNLGLHGIDKSRLCGFSVISLVDWLTDSHEGFFSDHRLREGLLWLARESLPQPVLHCVHTRELVRNHLNTCLEIRGKAVSEVGPKHFISAFNKALEQSLEQVAMAAKSNPTCWPCSEIALLDESTNEYRIAHAYLPSIGWSTEAKIRPILSALTESKLPETIDDFSWLMKGSKMGIEVERQRLQLEEYLVRYLSEISNTLGYSLARNEASVMLQKYVRLELRDSLYCIIPNWEMIFRRIFNWRLMNLSGEEASLSYILEQHVPSQPLMQDYMNYEMDASMNQNLENPSFDELLGVSCDLLPPATYRVQQEPLNSSARTAENGGVQVSEIISTNEITSTSGRGLPQDGDVAEKSDVTRVNSNSIIDSSTLDISIRANSGSDKLSVLLEQCNMVQNIIEEKLAVYFSKC